MLFVVLQTGLISKSAARMPGWGQESRETNTELLAFIENWYPTFNRVIEFKFSAIILNENELVVEFGERYSLVGVEFFWISRKGIGLGGLYCFHDYQNTNASPKLSNQFACEDIDVYVM